MKNLNKILGLSILFLLSFQCKRKECHKSLIVVNNSNKKLVIAYPGVRIIDKKNYDCLFLDSMILNPNEHKKYEYGLNGACIEDLSILLSVYFIDFNKYTSDYFPCDSLRVHNKVLKAFHLDIDSLKKDNFILTYP